MISRQAMGNAPSIDNQRTYGKIVLVGKDKQHGVLEFVLSQHSVQLLLSLGDTLPIVGVDDEDDSLSVLEVMSPERTDLVLSTDVPDGEVDVLILNGLYVEA